MNALILGIISSFGNMRPSSLAAWLFTAVWGFIALRVFTAVWGMKALRFRHITLRTPLLAVVLIIWDFLEVGAGRAGPVRHGIGIFGDCAFEDVCKHDHVILPNAITGFG